MERQTIKIESDGVTAKVWLNGEDISATLLDFSFHGDVENGIRIKWEGVMNKRNEKGMHYVENDEIATKEFHYDSGGVMRD